MRCYRISVLGALFSHDFVTYDDITAKELKKWYKKNYAPWPWSFIKVKQLSVSEVDPIWAIGLEKHDGIIKFV